MAKAYCCALGCGPRNNKWWGRVFRRSPELATSVGAPDWQFCLCLVGTSFIPCQVTIPFKSGFPRSLPPAFTTKLPLVDSSPCRNGLRFCNSSAPRWKPLESARPGGKQQALSVPGLHFSKSSGYVLCIYMPLLAVCFSREWAKE